MRDVAIIGAGRLGTALGLSLARKGFKVSAVSDADAAAARRLARRLAGARAARSNREAARGAGTVFLCVPDAAIRGLAVELAAAGADWRGRLAVHCSGALDARELAPLRRRGALTASAHPVRSFARGARESEPFRGTPVGIEGNALALARLGTMFRRLGAKPMLLRPGTKPAYHAACTLASNGLVFLLDMALELLAGAGFSRRKGAQLLVPLAQGTLRDVNKLGTLGALTGPLLRGDEATVARHLEALRGSPKSREAYRTLALRGLTLAAKGGLGPEGVRALKRRLEGR
jgi:predicted short-subunit dehydrogenase-like oxidoreductase (DUF2520 family)